MRPVFRRSFLSAALLFSTASARTSLAQSPASSPQSKPEPVAGAAWVARSDAIARELMLLDAKVSPESAAGMGLEGFDEQVTVPDATFRARQLAVNREEAALLEKKLASEKDPLVRQDLEIMLKNVRDGIRENDLDEKYTVPFFSAGQMVFGSLRSLLDDQIAPKRRAAALARLRKYTGLEKGFVPFTKLIQERTAEKLGKPGLLMPTKAEVERELATSEMVLAGIEPLFKNYGITGYEPALAKLKEQVGAYNAFVRASVLPKARTDFRLPPELYAFRLEQVGVAAKPEALAAQAHQAFDEIQAQMQELAKQIAQERKLPSSDYREVLRALRKEQLVGEAIIPHYKQRLADIEAIIQREHLISLPARPARIELASAAESAQLPAPHLKPPRLVGNSGEQGVFVLPLNNPAPMGDAKGGGKMDDFTNASASWSLTAHEARPGHELQFSSMVEHGVSTARSLYAFNSANVEGWGLYAEWMMYPYMPKDGQLMSLWMRGMRAARAFLDPELQSGKLTPEQALNFLEKDVVLSHGLASQEVERYTFRAPGQATSYFYGYTKLRALRSEVEKAMGPRFDAQKFHDFILAQGLLPPELLRRAVWEGYVKAPVPQKSAN